MAGGRSSSSSRHHHHHHHHHHRRHRSETSCPATSVAVAAARAGDAHAHARQEDPQGALRRSPAFPPRRQQQRLPQRWDSEQVRQPRCGEVAGGTAAGCAAVCCCLPCAVVEVVVLATVRAPAALCRRAVRGRRRGTRRSASAGQAGEIYELLVDEGSVVEAGEKAVVWPVAAATAPSEEAGELEKEVWARFYGAGFWRSPSQLSDHMR
uniref:Uncharacterized protein n=1 Tax=Oryza punctata TaxID=4537 RepID=A0A0E0KGW4_ORYPU